MLYHVVFSPRGFYNELDIRSFKSLELARDFALEVENNPNSWVATGSRRRNFLARIARQK